MSRTGHLDLHPDEPPPPRPESAGAGGGGRRRGTGRGTDEPPRGRGRGEADSGGSGRPEPSFASETLPQRSADLLAFLRSVGAELRRVSWPAWTEIRAATLVVGLTLLLIALYLGLWDWLLALLFGTPQAAGSMTADIEPLHRGIRGSAP